MLATHRHVRILGIVITAWTFVLMMLGGYVKAIHAGLACPDWPTCYGAWFPPFVDPEGFFTTHQIMAEWVHRFVASFLGPFILAFAYLTWRETNYRPVVRWTPLIAIAVLGVQVVLGGLTVLKFLQPIIVTSHLGLATVFFGMILMATTILLVAPYQAADDALPTDLAHAEEPATARNASQGTGGAA